MSRRKEYLLQGHANQEKQAAVHRRCGLAYGGFRWRLLGALPCWAVAAQPVSAKLLPAQPVPAQPIARLQPGPEHGVDGDRPEVYVNDSFEAADVLRQAASLASRGQWTKAATLLQRTSDRAGDKVLRVSAGSYVDIRAAINRIIAAWPAPGLDRYRALFEPNIRDALGQPTKARPLREGLVLFERYFCTQSALDLGDRLAQRAIEAGDLPLARYLYRRLLNEHPDGAAHADRLGAMGSVVSAMLGRDDPAWPPGEAGANLRWRGENHRLVDVLAEVRRDFASMHASPDPSQWPILAGDSARNRQASSHVKAPVLMWRFHRNEGTDRGLPRKNHDGPTIERPGRAGILALQPVVSGPFVFVQFSRNIVALHRRTGAVAWRFLDGEPSATESGFPDERAPRWDAVTVNHGRVYAALPGDPVPYYSYETPRNPAELICLDAKSGAVIWRLNQQLIEEEDFSRIAFDSSPVVAHGRLLIVGRRRRTFGFEDCYLYCFNASTGAMEYRSHLGSGSTGPSGSREATEAFVSLHDDTAFVGSNLGTVAAVYAHSGAIRWLRLYERDLSGGADGAAGAPRPNPILFSAGRLVVLPADGANVLILAADDGRILQAIPKVQLGGMTALLGLRGNILCGTGRVVTCYDLGAKRALWSSPVPEGAGVRGRGAWVDDHLLVPTQEGLITFRVDDGQRTQTAWDAQGRGGNLVALPDQILVGGADRVSAYVRKKEIWKALRDRMSAAPTDPLPALELAEVALNNREFPEALSVLDEAIQRAGGLAEPPDPGLAHRMFDDVLLFVDRLSARSLLDVDTLERLFRYASQCAPDPKEHLLYRFRFASLFESHERYDRAIRLYHQILRDRSLRDLPADPAAHRSPTAGAVAGVSIASLIAKHGRDLYAPYEKEADQWLSRATKTGDEATLRRVVDTFPNSRAAPRALIAHAAILAHRGQPEAAARRLASAYHRYPKQVDRPVLLRKIADAYEAAGRTADAYRWLTKAAREHPSVRFDTANGRMTFLEYRARLDAVRPQVEPARARIVVPLNDRYVKVFDNPVSLLVPRFGDDPGSAWSCYFVYTSRGIQAFESRSGQRKWSKPAPVRRKPVLLKATADVAVFANAFEVFALDAATGVRRWTHGRYPRNLDAPDADWEDAALFRTHALRGNRLVSVRDDGTITAVAIDTGRVLWSRVNGPAPTGIVRLSDPWVLYDIIQHDRVTICLVDAVSGEWVNAIETDGKRTVEELFSTLDGQVVVATPVSMAAYNPSNGRRRWRVTFRGRLRRASLRMDVDALVASDDGHHVAKYSMEDGERLWRSERLVPRGDDDMDVALQDGTVIVTSSSSVSAVDPVTGLTLWRGSTPDRPHFVSRQVTAAYVVAVDIPRGRDETPANVFFYDHRHAGGLIAPNGATPPLGALTDVKTVLVADSALLIQHGSTISGWVHK